MKVTEDSGSLIERSFAVSSPELAKLIAHKDWSKTPLGAKEQWSPALRMMVEHVLGNGFGLLLWWGPQFVQIYNDAYRPVLGSKHPGALGQPASECWAEIWNVIGPMIERPFRGGGPSVDEDIYLEPDRYGFAEETHFTVAYSPVFDDTVEGGIGGVLATVHEITQKVIGERRIKLLSDLGIRIAEAKSAEQACTIAAEALAGDPRDVPFALFYLCDAHGKKINAHRSSGDGACDKRSSRRSGPGRAPCCADRARHILRQAGTAPGRRLIARTQ